MRAYVFNLTCPTYVLTPSATGVLADPRREAQGATEPALEPLQSAYYVYDGDGNLVKSVINGKTTYYLGNPGGEPGARLYQKKVDGEDVTVQKYYSSGSAQIAVRTIQGESDTLQWLLGDHLPYRCARGCFAAQNSHDPVQRIWVPARCARGAAQNPRQQWHRMFDEAARDAWWGRNHHPLLNVGIE